MNVNYSSTIGVVNDGIENKCNHQLYNVHIFGFNKTAPHFNGSDCLWDGKEQQVSGTAMLICSLFIYWLKLCIGYQGAIQGE